MEDSGTISNLDFQAPRHGGSGRRAFDLDATVVSATGTLDDEPRRRRRVPRRHGPTRPWSTSKTAFDSSLLDFDFELDASATPTQAAVPAGLGLTSIDLDLGRCPPKPVPAFDAVPFSVADTQFDQPAAGGASAGVDERGGRDQARTGPRLREMGDKEGALELLEEVVAEGRRDSRPRPAI